MTSDRGGHEIDSGSFGKRFEIVKRLGAGGMGVVYEAIDQVNGDRVALKTLTRLSGNELYRFKNEFRSLREVVHPNLVRLGELHGADDRWFFTMELVNGVDLLRYLRGGSRASQPSPNASQTPLFKPSHRPSAPSGPSEPSSGDRASRDEDDSLSDDPTPGPRPVLRPPPSFEEPATELALGRVRALNTNAHAPSVYPTNTSSGNSANSVSSGVRGFGPTSWDEVRGAMLQLNAALGGLHAHNKIHRDLKPSNVMVTTDGRVVVLDFGLVTDVADGDEESRDDFVGTIAYMAPEQAMGRSVGPAADYYALGATLYRVLTGKVPFDGPGAVVLSRKQTERPLDPRTFDPDVPDDLAALCLDLLDPDPARRPSEQEVAVRLGGIAGNASDVIATGHGYIGHAEELDQLAALADEVIDAGAMRSVLVYGEPGSGRSSLLSHFLDEQRRRRKGTVVLRSRCRAEEELPFKALDGLVDSLSQELRRSSSSRMTRWLPQDIEHTATVFPVLKRVPAIAELAAQTVNLPPDERRAKAFDALRALLASIARERLVVIVLADLEWTDADSVAELDRMFRGDGAPRVLLIGTRAVTEESLGTDLRQLGMPPRTVALRMNVLADAEASALAERLQPTLDPALRRQFVRAAKGQPGTLVEILHFARRAEGEKTHTLSELVARRLDAVSEAARYLVRLTALAGFPVRESLAAMTLSLSPESIRIAASELVTERLLRIERRRGATHLESPSDLVRQVVLDTISDEEQKQLRTLLVEALGHDKKSAERPELAVEHLLLLGRTEEAALRLEEAADGAATVLAFERAAKLYERVLAFPGLGDARRKRAYELAGRCHAWSGRLPEAAASLAEAARLTPLGIDRAELFARAGEIYASAYDADRMVPVVREGFAALGLRYPDGNARVVGRILGYLMGILFLPVLRTLRGRTNDAKRRVLQSLYLSIQIGGYVSHDLAKATLGSFAAIYQGSWVASGIERVKAAWSLGVIYAGTGFARLMQRCVDDAHETAERATDESARGEAAFGATICFTKMNQYERAAAEAERGLAHGSWMGAFAYVGMCTRAGMMLGLLGRVSEALVWYERAFSRIRSDVDNRFISTCRDVREVLFVIAGTPGEGKAYFERFVASKDFANGRGQIGIGTGLLFCHETGEDGALLEALLDAHERTRVSPRHPADEELPQYVGAMYAYARRALAGGDASLRNLETAVARLRGVTKWRAYAAHLPVAEALLALAKSDPAAALTYLEAAERRAVADEHVTALFETYLVRARTYVSLGKPLHARLALGAAETLARELSWHGRIERLNRELRGFFQDARASENVTASQS